MFQAPAEELALAMSQATGTAQGAGSSAYRKSPTWQEDFNFALDYYSNLLAAAAKPLPEALASVAEAETRAGGAKAKGLLISGMMLPATAGPFSKAVDAAALIRAAETALAVERYRLKHDNTLPSSLDALVPEQLQAVPADPFDGKPLRYERLVGRGYVVYSVGKDLQDNHGASAPAGGKDTAPADIAFAVRR
jgi:hypothetical protein